MTTNELRRQHGRERVEAYRNRCQHCRLLVPVEVGPQQLAALEKLALLDRGARDKSAIACAVMRFLNAASHVGALGDGLWPADEELSEGLAA